MFWFSRGPTWRGGAYELFCSPPPGGNHDFGRPLQLSFLLYSLFSLLIDQYQSICFRSHIGSMIKQELIWLHNQFYWDLWEPDIKSPLALSSMLTPSACDEASSSSITVKIRCIHLLRLSLSLCIVGFQRRSISAFCQPSFFHPSCFSCVSQAGVSAGVIF